MFSFLKKWADVSNPESLSNQFRAKRFRYFLDLIEGLPKPVKILDIGGTQLFWERMKFTSPDDVYIILLNNEPVKTTLPNFTFVHGSASEIDLIPNNNYDIIFSNSVIEHAGNFSKQKKMADGITGTGKKFYIQTPNFYFPLEPHFLFLFFQFLPKKFKIFLLRHFNLGWYEKQCDKQSAERTADSVNLVKFKELKVLFPNSKIIREKFFFLTKSFIVLNNS